MRELEQEFRNRTVLITGADGFVGSHLTEQMVAWKADTRVFVRATSSGELRNISHLRNHIKVYRGDLTDKHAVDAVVKDLKGGNDTIIFHLAAQAHVGESWERPYETIASNVLGTLNLLQSIVDYDVRLFKFDTAGTSEEYGNISPEMLQLHRFNSNGSPVFYERSPINPKSIYATAKLAADFLTLNYYDAFRLPGVTTRMFNNYGPRQNPRYITGTVITQALFKKRIHIGHVKAKRDFCYVSDGIMGHIHTALFGNPGEVYVYGYGQNISIEAWINLILRVGRDEGYWDTIEIELSPERFRPGTSDVEELLVGYEKLNRLTGWAPQVSWEEGLRQTIRWYSRNIEKWIGRIDWDPRLACDLAPAGSR